MKKYENNIFTKIVNKEIDSNILYETEYTMVIEDKFKKNNTHWLVLPKKNYINLNDFLNKAEDVEILDYFKTMKKFLNQIDYSNVLFNNGLKASQSVFHMHGHIMSSQESNSEDIKNKVKLL